jgi:hypothetical protein
MRDTKRITRAPLMTYRRILYLMIAVWILLQPPNVAEAKGWRIKKPRWVQNIQQTAGAVVQSVPVVRETVRVVEKLPEKVKETAKKVSKKGVEVSLKATIKEGKGGIKTLVKNGEAVVKRDAKNLSTKGVVRAVSNPGKTISDAGKRTGKAISDEAERAEEKLKGTWWYGQLAGELLLQFMERPRFILVGADRPGRPVIYVNGMATTEKQAREDAELISEKLGRPVNLLHNKSSIGDDFHTGLQADGFGSDDLSEVAYDKAWPVWVVNQLGSMSANLLGTLTGARRLQGNPTTRQLAWAIYHSKEPVDIVSHSQGCLQVRNALYTMTLLSATKKARDVAWVLAGPPLNDNEILTGPGKKTMLDYANDPTPKIVGARGGGGLEKSSVADHDLGRFAAQLDPSMLWPQATK